nr:NYN domain-containing protein [Clostridia bacterium]
KARENGTAVLLEPWYEFKLVLPTEYAGRAISDLQMMSASIKPMETEDSTGMSVLTGCAPAAKMHTFPPENRPYPLEVQNYTRGRGKLTLTFHGYAPCHDQESIVGTIGYEPEHDTVFPADSVFCSHGSGNIVPWNEADAMMHVESVFVKKQAADNSITYTLKSRRGTSHSRPYSYAAAVEEDKILKDIFERTYGPIAPRSIFIPPAPVTTVSETELTRDTYMKMLDPSQEYLLVDGYNIIFAWEELKKMSHDSLDLARQTLIHILSNYQGFKKCNLILVFDAYKVSDGVGAVERHGGIYVIYTRSRETADTYIEKVTYDIGRDRNVMVATSDEMEQIIIMGHGAKRISALGLYEEVCRATEEVRRLIEAINHQSRLPDKR